MHPAPLGRTQRELSHPDGVVLSGDGEAADAHVAAGRCVGGWKERVRRGGADNNSDNRQEGCRQAARLPLPRQVIIRAPALTSPRSFQP